MGLVRIPSMRDGLDASLRSARILFAKRLNTLFSNTYPPLSSGEAEAKIRETGTPITVGIISELRVAQSRIPSPATVKALADFFGVDASYFFDEGHTVVSSVEHQESDGPEPMEVPDTHDSGDATAWRFADYQPTEDSTAVGRHRAPESPSAATPQAAEVLASGQTDVFAERLNLLFESSTGPDGVPYSSSDVAASLQEDGLPVSANIIKQLRGGSGGVPKQQVVEALAYFFSVDVDYFVPSKHSSETTEVPRRDEPLYNEMPTVNRRPIPAPSTAPITALKQFVPVGSNDLGEVITILSAMLSAGRQEMSAKDIDHLLWLLRDVGESLSLSDDRTLIRRGLLEMILIELNATQEATNRHGRLIHRLRTPLGDD
jgi:hypothetical protein